MLVYQVVLVLDHVAVPSDLVECLVCDDVALLQQLLVKQYLGLYLVFRQIEQEQFLPRSRLVLGDRIRNRFLQ